MSVSLKHKFTSAVADGDDTSVVRPSNWNDEHDLTLSAGKVLGRDTSGAGVVQELPISVDPNGNVGISSTPQTGRTLVVAKNITGAVGSYGALVGGAIQSDVTMAAYLIGTSASTAAVSFTLGSLVHYSASQSTIGAGSTVTNQYGYFASSNLTGATNNYGFYSDIASGTGRYNFYAAGTAENYFGGQVTVNASLNFSGFGNRIRADLSNGTVSNRLLFQNNSTPNSYSMVGVIPSGTGSETYIQLYNASNPVNCGLMQMQITTTQAVVASTRIGTGTYLPLIIEVGGSERLRVETTGVMYQSATGKLGVGTGATPLTTLEVKGNYSQSINSLNGSGTVDLSTGNYFTDTISANRTFTFSGHPTNRAFGFVIELDHTSGTLTWPSTVRWPGGTAPSLTTGKTHIFVFFWDFSNSLWRGAYLTNYTTA